MSRAVLVVEDDSQLQVLATRVLETGGFRPLVAGSGREALRLADADPTPELVLMDLSLPDQDGIDVTRQLLQRHPGLPVIAVSAHALPADRERAHAAGCSGFLTKPYQIDELLALVRDALGEDAPA